MRHHLGPAVLFLALSSLPAAAERQKCDTDIQKFCPSKEGARTPVRRCLTEHLSELSADCRAFVEKANGEMSAMRAACEPDVKAHCPPPTGAKENRPPGGVIGCLMRNEAKLSAPCKTALAAKRRRPGAPAPSGAPPPGAKTAPGAPPPMGAIAPGAPPPKGTPADKAPGK